MQTFRGGWVMGKGKAPRSTYRDGKPFPTFPLQARLNAVLLGQHQYI